MVARFLLHDPSNMSIRGMSGERKLSIGGRVLEWHLRRQEAFCLLEGDLSGSGPLQRFGPSLPGDLSKVSKLEHSWAGNGGNSLPCQENVAAV